VCYCSRGARSLPWQRTSACLEPAPAPSTRSACTACASRVPPRCEANCPVTIGERTCRDVQGKAFSGEGKTEREAACLDVAVLGQPGGKRLFQGNKRSEQAHCEHECCRLKLWANTQSELGCAACLCAATTRCLARVPLLNSSLGQKSATIRHIFQAREIGDGQYSAASRVVDSCTRQEFCDVEWHELLPSAQPSVSRNVMVRPQREELSLTGRLMTVTPRDMQCQMPSDSDWR
jgi:hypothetical protein